MATELRVYQIASVLGYTGSHDTFSEVFERWSGLPPSAYRKSHGGPGCDAYKKRLTAVAVVEAKARSVEIKNLSADLGWPTMSAEQSWCGAAMSMVLFQSATALYDCLDPHWRRALERVAPCLPSPTSAPTIGPGQTASFLLVSTSEPPEVEMETARLVAVWLDGLPH